MWFHFGGDETDTRCWGPPPGTNINVTGTYPWNERVWHWLQQHDLAGFGNRTTLGPYGPHVFLKEALGYFSHGPLSHEVTVLIQKRLIPYAIVCIFERV